MPPFLMSTRISALVYLLLLFSKVKKRAISSPTFHVLLLVKMPKVKEAPVLVIRRDQAVGTTLGKLLHDRNARA
ncbi:hypothetical protein BN3658_02219 [Coriobacteriaceae bacterium CHKCI002]|nr:hypothetical protein BN3658_02219 [Coriobacteriaceae bacterium CHKCI002]